MSRPSTKLLYEQAAEASAAAQAILNKADAENRDPTKEERIACEELASNARDARRQIDEIRARLGASSGPFERPDPMGNAAPQRGTYEFRTAEGNTIHGLTHDQSVSTDPPPCSVGSFVRGLITNNWDGVPDRFAATIGSDTEGGYLTDSRLDSRFVDLARSASVAMKAGAVTVPMTTSELRLGRATADPTATWRAETVRVNSSDPAFDMVVLRPKTLAAIVPMSVEWAEDAANGPQLIENALQKALGLSLDRAIIKGVGAASEPKGIRNHPDVNTITSVGVPSGFDDISTAIRDILNANFDSNNLEELAWLLHPTFGALYDQKKDGQGLPLRPPRWVERIGDPLMTTSIDVDEGAGGNESFSIVGHFPQVIVGMRTNGIRIRVAEDGSVTDGTTTYNATDQLMKFVVAYLRADVAILRPTWFTVLSGMTTS